MAPPVTPSPHRFLAVKRDPPSPQDEAALPAVPHKRPEANGHVDLPPSQLAAKRFAARPRFGPPPPTTQAPESRPKWAAAQAFRMVVRPENDVEETRIHPDDEEMLDGGPTATIAPVHHPTTTGSSTSPSATTPWTDRLAFSPKRPRPDTGDGFDSADRPAFKRPHTPTTHFAKPTTHVTPFRPNWNPSSNATPAPAAIQRPAFLRGSGEPSHQPAEPLPETFSPHRRGQKFVPGGMAATMQQWIIETGQAAVQSRRGSNGLRTDEYVMRVRADHICGDAALLVHGRTASGTSAHLMLIAGATRAEEDIYRQPLRGSDIGLRAPAWEVEMDGLTWTVGVDWKVLS